jgi:hypothetical protein
MILPKYSNAASLTAGGGNCQAETQEIIGLSVIILAGKDSRDIYEQGVTRDGPQVGPAIRPPCSADTVLSSHFNAPPNMRTRAVQGYYGYYWGRTCSV